VDRVEAEGRWQWGGRWSGRKPRRQGEELRGASYVYWYVKRGVVIEPRKE
jgi:hypothetical protein